MDSAQIILLIVVLILTGLLVFLGVQVYFIFHELRKTLEKVNKVLDNADEITTNVARPLSDFTSLITSVKTGMSLFNMFTKKRGDDKNE